MFTSGVLRPLQVLILFKLRFESDSPFLYSLKVSVIPYVVGVTVEPIVGLYRILTIPSTKVLVLVPK